MVVNSDTAPPPSTVLETGWLPTTPIGDTVPRRFMLHYAACMSSIATAHGGRVLHRPDVIAADLGRPGGLSNSAVLLQPLIDGADTVADVERWYADGHGDVLLWSPWPTPDLRGRGWQLEGHPPLLVREAGGPAPPARDDVVVAEVTDATGVDDFSRLMVDGFPFGDLQPYRSGSLFDDRLRRDPRWRLWLAAVDGRHVAAGALFVEHGLASLALAATLPQARGRGAWYALVRARLLAAPDLMSCGIFSDLSRPGIERLGYLPITRFTLWRRSRPAQRP